MVEPGIVDGMVEYVVHAVLDLHRDMPAYRRQQQRGEWNPLPVQPAASRRVGVLGQGVLGQAVLTALGRFGFDTMGWSRSQAAQPLGAFLARSDVLVCLLPLTDATRGLLDAALFAQLPRGAALVHVGRGAQLVVPDLLASLDNGTLAEAVLDVTDPEPLPPGHGLWQHPRVRITPHIASMTQPESAARVAIDNLRRFAAGQPLVGLVDRGRGY
jgi:glyoxylate/hydroxypyruvate reductase A